MPLKCPFCGKEYFHDSKICQTCKDKSINSGFIHSDKKISQKWNCAFYIGYDTLAFGRQKLDRSCIKISSEPKITNIKPKTDYYWSCDTKFRFKNYSTLEPGISQLGILEKIPATGSIILEKEENISLIYE